MAAPPLAAFIMAELRMKTPEEGGRRRSIASGYRCNCWIGEFTAAGERSYNDAVIYLESDDTLAPGATGAVRLQPAYPDSWTDLVVGSVIDVCEGSRVVGEATVTELFPSP